MYKAIVWYSVSDTRILTLKCDDLRGRVEVHRVGFIFESETCKAISPVILGGFRPFLAHWKGLEELYKVVVTDHQLVVESTS